MFCGFCGTNLPDEAEFCSNCGKATVSPNSSQENITEENTSIVPTGVAQDNTSSGELTVVNSGPAVIGGNINGAAAAAPVRAKGSKKVIIAVCAAVAAVLVVLAIVFISSAASNANINERIGKLEDAIYNLSASSVLDEDEVVRLYEEYNSLSDTQKREVANRQIIISAYQDLEALITQRQKAAATVDKLIAAIDYTNVFSEADTFVDAFLAYNALDDKERGYVTLFDKLQSAYKDIGDMNVKVTASNFFDIFAIEYSVGEKTNYGSGTTVSQSGYDINWDRYGGSITPNYDFDTRNDYAIPVHIYIASRYPNLITNCSFYINLHQTYNGLGIIDSDTHEFELQSATIYYDSSQGIGDYLIYVENNDASNSLWSLFGYSFDWSDMTHSMNDFDVSRVEISSVSGSVTY